MKTPTAMVCAVVACLLVSLPRMYGQPVADIENQATMTDSVPATTDFVPATTDLVPATAAAPAVAEPASAAVAAAAANAVPDDACLDALLKEINKREAMANTRGASAAFYSAWKKRWAACGGELAPTSPEEVSALQAAACKASSQSLPEAVGIAATKACNLACYRNSLTDGGVLCNLYCGLFSRCNAEKGKWGKCQKVG